jgi:hypothetical protein
MPGSGIRLAWGLTFLTQHESNCRNDSQALEIELCERRGLLDWRYWLLAQRLPRRPDGDRCLQWSVQDFQLHIESIPMADLPRSSEPVCTLPKPLFWES